MAEAVAELESEFELFHLSPCIGTEVLGIDVGSVSTGVVVMTPERRITVSWSWLHLPTTAR